MVGGAAHSRKGLLLVRERKGRGEAAARGKMMFFFVEEMIIPLHLENGFTANTSSPGLDRPGRRRANGPWR